MSADAKNDDEIEELVDVELDEEEDDLDEDEDPGALLAQDDEEDGEDASLEELLAQRSARRAPEPEEEDDIMALASEREPKAGDVGSSKVIPMRDRKEFVCKRCYLVKARSQLADPERMFCRDCV